MRLLTGVRSSSLLGRNGSAICLLIGAGLIGGLLAASEVPNVDSAWLLIATGRFMNGAVIGRDLFEMNPPLIYWLMTPAVWFSRHTGSDYYTTYCLWVGLLAAASGLLIRNSLRELGIGAALAALAALAELGLFVLVSGYDYGQRDPIAFQLAAPFLFTEALRATGQRPPLRLVVPCAILAAIGFLIKPYMAFVPAALFAWRIMRERSVMAIICPDAIIMLTIAVSYVAYVAIRMPGYLALIRWIMLAYPAYDSTPGKLLVAFVPVIFVAFLLWLTLVRPARRAAAAAVGVFLVAAVGYALGGLTQLKGWYYHLLPCYLALSGGCILYVVLHAQRASARLVPLRIALGLPLVLLFIGISRANYFERGTVKGWDIAKAIGSGDRGPFLAITSSMWGVFPAINEMNVEWASRLEAQWMVPAAVELSQGTQGQRAEAERLRAQATRLITADLVQWRPDTVVVKTGLDQAMSHPIDWIGFFSADRAFSDVWSGYCAEDRVGEWDVYRHCVRR